MQLDLQKMLDKCNKGQWNVNDFDWTQKPKAISREKEIRLCQYFCDMSHIERLAGALFLALSKRLDDPTLKAIYQTFHADEVRHSVAAHKLMDYFDVHHYQVYTTNMWMNWFTPFFIKAIDTLNPAFANSFILGGELILDIALLRSLNEYADDPLSNAVVDKVNQDESRHLAMDFYMTEYCSTHKMERASGNKKGLTNPNLWGVMAFGPGFFNDVFFRPMQVMDPTNYQMKEVMKRIRRFNDRPEVQKNPTVQNWQETLKFFESPMGSRVGSAAIKVLKTTTGLDFSFVRAASTENIYGKGKEAAPKTDDAAEQFEKALSN